MIPLVTYGKHYHSGAKSKLGPLLEQNPLLFARLVFILTPLSEHRLKGQVQALRLTDLPTGTMLPHFEVMV